ncbi:MAG: DEAD/DEAH box helicase [Candidatus Hodarchaeales archaeon]
MASITIYHCDATIQTTKKMIFMNDSSSTSKNLKITFRGDDLVVLGKIPKKLLTLENKPDSDFTRFLPCDFFKITTMLDQLQISYVTSINQKYSLLFNLTPKFVLRDYQKQALNKWASQEQRGTLVLPTGSGKTIIGLAAIKKLAVRTLIVVPTIDLMNQWTDSFEWFEEFPNDNQKGIGRYGGGKKEVQALTVATYESARLYSRRLREEFGFLIMDEVHHLSGESWREIVRAYLAPYKLGLTATLDPEDEGYESIIKYVGPVAFHLTPQELRRLGAIANYEVKKVLVNLNPELQDEYDSEITVFRAYMTKNRLFGKKNGFQQLIFRYRDPDARRALDAHRTSRKIAFNATGKLHAIKDIINCHPKEKILLFCESIPFVEQISEFFLVPVISSKTPMKERKTLLKKFKGGDIRVLAAGRVLDEGIDVAQCSVGIIISGSAQKRQFVQRLGRVLRPHPTKSKAILYEIVTQDTTEEKTAIRRHVRK